MPNVEIYSTAICPYCIAAQRFLKSKGVAFRTIYVDADAEQREIMERKSGRRTVPQIFIDDRHIGGFTDLEQLNSVGELDRLLFPDGR